MIVKIKKLHEDAVTPVKGKKGDAGFDLTAINKKYTSKYIEYDTGIAVEIPEGYVGLLFPRSSITKEDLMLKNSVGVIDSGYRGEIKFRFNRVFNDIHYEDDGRLRLNYDFVYDHMEYVIGDRIGQLVIQKLPDVELVEVDELSDSERGEGGFGSTNK